MSALYIDADACPVKDEAERVATRHQLTMYVVSNGGLRPSQNPLVETVIVDSGADVADMWIADRCGPGDVVVTGDIPLAAKCIASGARVLRHNGDAFSERNIGQQLAMRDLMEELRTIGEVRGGPPPLNQQDRQAFANVLDRLLAKHLKS